MKIPRKLVEIALVVGTTSIAPGQELCDKETMKRDQLRVAVQEICPISGEKLGAPGRPVKARIGEEEVFLCSEACLKGKVKPKHWATIHRNFAQAQRICPVMEHKLPKNAKWTIVEGQIIYVCCPPCTKKIAADPQAYLKKLDALYMSSLRARQARR